VEKKSTEISQVEAIEKEIAQTESFGRCGVWVDDVESWNTAEVI